MPNQCECVFHRYRVVHICCDHGTVIDHSQGSWDEHRACNLESFPIELYEHGDTPDALRARAREHGYAGH